MITKYRNQRKVMGYQALIIAVAVLFSACSMGIEDTQEPHNNPMDPMYYSVDGRLILGEPELSPGSTSTVKIYWKEVQSGALLGEDWDIAIYYFRDTEKVQIAALLQNYEDVSGLLPSGNIIKSFKQSTYESEEWDQKYIEFDKSTVTPAVSQTAPIYFIAKFSKSDSSANFSNIVVYPAAQ
jgi:hypothetical protein